MLGVFHRRKRIVEKVYREGNMLFLQQESGLIRIWPQTGNIIRVSYTENGNFSDLQGSNLADLSASCTWDFSEDEDNIIISTEELLVKVARLTGSISYVKKDGTVLLCEKDRESKTLEEFDSYKMVVNENTQLEKIQTADGIKFKVTSADKVFDKKLYHTKLHLAFAEDEKLFGLGQAEEGVWDLRHTTQYLHQANLKIAMPVLLSTKGYGIFLSTESPVIFSDEQYGSYLYTEADEYLDYYFIAGSFDDVVRGYRSLSGKAVMLPKWAFGYVQSQERYETQDEIIKTVQEFRKRDFGIDTIVLDWLSWPDNQWGQKSFDETRFPDPTKMVEDLHEMDTHFMISIWPNMAMITDNHQEFLKKGLLLPASEIYDCFNEAGRELYWDQVNRALFKHGIDSWWCDSSEPLTPEWTRRAKPLPNDMYHEFVTSAANCMPIEKSNAYGSYHAKTLYDGQRGVTDEKRVTNLTRNGYTGSQKYGTILWSGDTCASWDTLKKQIVAGLQFTATGLPYWTLDIGAFFVKNGAQWFWDGKYDETTGDNGYRELYVRWFQYGAFLPIFRSHGTDCRREPWHFGNEGEMFYDALVKANRLRYHLMPYIYSLAGDVWKQDGTMLRMLAFDFAQDEKALMVSDQFMFGPALMVCPVTKPMYYEAGNKEITDSDKTRKVYLPQGTDWYDFHTFEKYTGGQEITVKADIDSIPVFVKAGSVIPTCEAGVSVAALEGKDITLKVFAGADGKFTLYEDSGDGYGYENGEYALTHITYDDKTKKVEWTTEGKEMFRKGNLMVEIIG